MKNLNVLMYVFKAVMILYFLWHWVACGWFYINDRIEFDIYEITWMKVFDLKNKTMGQ